MRCRLLIDVRVPAQRVSSPASSARVPPVTYLAPPEATNRTAQATSSGSIQALGAGYSQIPAEPQGYAETSDVSVEEGARR
jgi:hypothetical protein